MLVALTALYSSEGDSNKWLDILKVVLLSGFWIFTLFFLRKNKDFIENEDW